MTNTSSTHLWARNQRIDNNIVTLTLPLGALFVINGVFRSGANAVYSGNSADSFGGEQAHEK